MKRLCAHVIKARPGTLASFCRKAGTPSVQTIYGWLDDDPALAEMFSKAKAIGYDAMAQQCLEIADDGDDANVRHRKLRIWTRLQLLARWDTARYGDKVHLVGGVHHQHQHNMSDDEITSEVMQLLAEARQKQIEAAEKESRLGRLN